VSLSKPLSGLLVIALEQAVAAPTCSVRLADAGARVIKIERAEGDFARGYDKLVKGESAYFVWLNRGKESIALDVKTEPDRALLARMVARADVFIQNLAPGAAGRLGFGAAELRQRHPRLVTVDISGYGESGPYAKRKAYDLLVQAESGLAFVTGRPEGPGRVGVSVCDIATGLYAYQAVLEALLARERTGEGRQIAVSLFDAMAEWMSVPYLQTVYGGQQPKRVGLAHPSIAPYGVFAAADGELLISIQSEREWRKLASDVLRRPELLDDPRLADMSSRVANREHCDSLVAEAFAAETLAALTERLTANEIAYGLVNDVAGLARHPHLRRVSVETPGGTIETIAPPPIVAGLEESFGAVPAIDQHGAALRREFAE
jgi:crotonobetainyl-CoA:carnitine CoA-transferase CaiB-like acyl-CoA transferase